MPTFALPEAAAWRLIDVPMRADERGLLGVVEAVPGVPFDMRRVFFVTRVAEGCRRGAHAHRTLRQLLVCVSGQVEVVLDDGNRREQITLDGPARALYIPPMTWATQESKAPDTTYLVLADQPYDEGDYIRNYDDFLAAARA
ncbi:MAG TPA: FdtA/QdtA family cupin domain-containing protein [Gemmatimonadaceae bacterium]|nr:FdtA/QdtA family cupin domain-containing protein [Gemmatimonadaceae bacterium]